MNNQTIIAIVIAVNAAIEVYELQKIAPMTWPPAGLQAASLCTDAGDPDGGCPEAVTAPW
jgi:hypothetical protein